MRLLMCLALTLGMGAPAPAPVSSASGFLYKASLIHADYYASDRVAKREKALRAVEAVLAKLRDSIAYAESADIPEAAQEAAAKTAGFESASRIGPYLRTLISSHHDTLAVAIK